MQGGKQQLERASSSKDDQDDTNWCNEGIRVLHFLSSHAATGARQVAESAHSTDHWRRNESKLQQLYFFQMLNLRKPSAAAAIAVVAAVVFGGLLWAPLSFSPRTQAQSVQEPTGSVSASLL